MNRINPLIPLALCALFVGAQPDPAFAREHHGPLLARVATFFPEAVAGGFNEMQIVVENRWKKHAIDVTIVAEVEYEDGLVTPVSGPFTITLEPLHGFELLPLFLVPNAALPGTAVSRLRVEAVRTDRPGPDANRGPTFNADSMSPFEVVE